MMNAVPSSAGIAWWFRCACRSSAKPAKFAAADMPPAAGPPPALPVAGPPAALPPAAKRTLPVGKGDVAAARTKRCATRSVRAAARSFPVCRGRAPRRSRNPCDVLPPLNAHALAQSPPAAPSSCTGAMDSPRRGAQTLNPSVTEERKGSNPFLAGTWNPRKRGPRKRG
jgi:hypothetical protein